jgi:hypothetical protein
LNRDIEAIGVFISNPDKLLSVPNNGGGLTDFNETGAQAARREMKSKRMMTLFNLNFPVKIKWEFLVS